MDIAHPAPRRILLVVLDDLGIGAVDGANPPRLAAASSLAHAIAAARVPDVPFLAAAGLFAAAGLLPATGRTMAAAGTGWGRTRQEGRFPESYSAHWEMAGHVTDEGWALPGGLPPALFEQVVRATGRRLIGNLPLYGRPLAEIPRDVIADHLATGDPILITQAAAEPVAVIALYGDPAAVPRDSLYGLVRSGAGRLAAEGSFPLRARLCARTFAMSGGIPVAAVDRLDCPFFTPPSTSLFDGITAGGRTVYGTGKIGGLFNSAGFTACDHEWGSDRILRNTIDLLGRTRDGLVWANFNDLSRPMGSGRDPAGWIDAIETLDTMLRTLHAALRPGDLMIVTGDHGVDPTLTGEHTYEWTPLLVMGAGDAAAAAPAELGSRRHVDIGATIAAVWRLTAEGRGTSFADALGIDPRTLPEPVDVQAEERACRQ